jgi:hypothetical protein
MKEDTLAWLEAGFRAQREKQRSAPLQSSPGLSPADNDRPVPKADPHPARSDRLLRNGLVDQAH